MTESAWIQEDTQSMLKKRELERVDAACSFTVERLLCWGALIVRFYRDSDLLDGCERKGYGFKMPLKVPKIR